LDLGVGFGRYNKARSGNVMESLTNALSVDVEDYFQVSAFERNIERSSWDNLEHRVESNTSRILKIFDEHDAKATFFVLGWIAERYPAIVKSILAGGHEIASHGYGHQRVSDLSREEFRNDVVRAKAILEDIGGRAVRGYRAPSYSISQKNKWALDILADTGHEYSSSIYPIHHDHYGFPGAPRFAFRDLTSGLVEIPITTVKLLSDIRPAGGGGFFRFYPYALSKWLIRRVNGHDEQSAVFYFHPWEIDPEQPRIPSISVKSRFRHYLNLSKTEGRLRRLLADFSWAPMEKVFMAAGKDLPEIELK
jgi:polysaccharide deacetylase family protein (PEP-CTERM system associated)